jgi:SulP family sulfate permease
MSASGAPATRSWHFDLLAGLTVAIVALPLALGFGVTSGAGPGAGMVTAIVAGFIAGLLGGSNYQVSGPTGAMVVVLVPIVMNFGASALVVVGVGAGIVMVVFGALRLGRFAEAIPWPVMEGFTLGIAIIIALQQIPIIFEVARGEGTETLVIAAHTLKDVTAQPLHLWSIAVVGFTLASKVLWRRLARLRSWANHIPASAVAITLVTTVAWSLHLPIATIGELPTSDIFSFTWQLPEASIGSLIYAAIVVAVLGGVESLLAARVADAMVKRRDGEAPTPYAPNRELVGQGIATVAASMVGGMPSTGAIARTAVNVHAGARTRLAAMTHAIVLLIFLVGLGQLVAHIPVAALAGVLLGASWRIANPESIAENLRATWPGRISYLVTALGVVSIDLIWGTVIGIATHYVATLIEKKNASS